MFRKVFLYVAQDAAVTPTLEIVAPHDARLYYVTTETWMTAPSADEVIRSATRRVEVTSCTTSLTGYFGRILAGHGECATLAITNGGTDRHIITIPGSGGTC